MSSPPAGWQARWPIVSALIARASAIVLRHHHLSGYTKPSTTDLQFTKKMKAGRELLVSPYWITESYYSLADERLLKPFLRSSLNTLFIL
ncbi:JAB domain-containing protein [Pontibacter burrus]|uniref:RadC-like JAB domain-containing protein n=1 Tax=Pontibacter burrus TaxID=2704466 RepID=A0A6B3LVF9_9BACT|nr:hypothetical protein [Pontibacter burrus]